MNIRSIKYQYFSFFLWGWGGGVAAGIRETLDRRRSPTGRNLILFTYQLRVRGKRPFPGVFDVPKMLYGEVLDTYGRLQSGDLDL